MEKLRVGIIKKSGETIAKNVDTKEEADNFVLKIAEQSGVKYYKVIDRQTQEIIERGKDL